MAAAREALRKLEISNTPVIIALHHHIGVRSKGLLDRGLSLCNPDDFLSIFPTGRSYVSFNGHRHMHYTGAIDGRITVVSGASTTLGNEVKIDEAKVCKLPRIARYELFWKENGDFKGLKRLPNLFPSTERMAELVSQQTPKLTLVSLLSKRCKILFAHIGERLGI